MSNINAPTNTKKIQNSILSFSSQSTSAFRWFSNEDFLHMMSEMTLEEIRLDLERFKTLEEYEICKKIEFVIEGKKNAELIDLNIIMADVRL